MSIRNDVLNVCNRELGIAEPVGDDKYIQWFNENILKTWSFAMNVAWCHIWATYAAFKGGLSSNEFPATASCDSGMNWFKNRKQWENAEAYGGKYVPKKGDVVYYSSSNNQNDSTHVGWVEECDGTLLTAIEGNYSNKVGKRTIYLSNPYILGYGIVNFPDESFKKEHGNWLAGTGLGTGYSNEVLNVRSGPGNSYAKVGSLPKGKSIEVLAITENNWLKVVWDIADQGVAFVDNTKQQINITWKEEGYRPKEVYEVGTVVLFNGNTHYSSAKSNNPKPCESGKAKITQYAKGTTHPYHLIAIDFSSSNVYGWVDTKDISPLAQFGYDVWTAKVTASVLNVRTGAGVENGKLQSWPQLMKGNKIDVLGESKAKDGSKWYYVNIHGNRGYVHSAYVAKA